jgi:hypothetical protein
MLILVKCFLSSKSTKIIELSTLQGLKNSKRFFLYQIGRKILRKTAVLRKNSLLNLTIYFILHKNVLEKYIQSIIFAAQTKN